jgi:transposase-like protein
VKKKNRPEWANPKDYANMKDRITTLPRQESALDRLRDALSSKVREALEELLQVELDEVLGALRHERTGERRGYRNGSYERRLVTETGPTTLTVPRARIDDGSGKTREHESEIVPKYERRSRRVNEAIVACYLAGANTRRVRKALEPLLGSSQLSKSAISRVVTRLKARFDEWMERDLSQEGSLVLYLDALHLPVRLARRVVRVPVQAVIGVRESGEKLLLSLRIAPSESTASWKGVVEDLAHRGLTATQLTIVDGNQGLLRSIRETWPKADIQRCTKHKLENLLAKAPKYCHAELKRDYRDIIYAEDLIAAQRAYDAFCAKWTKLCPEVVRSLQEAGNELLTFYRYPKSQWKSLRTTNQIERLNGEFRRRTKTQGSFSNEGAALVVLWALVAFGHIRLRKIVGWQDMPEITSMLNAAA